VVTHETPLVLKIKKAILKAYPSAWAFKVVGSREQESGVPDLLVCVDGLLFGIEVKYQRPGESHEHALDRATALQKIQIAELRAAGATAGVVTTAAEALDMIRERLSAWEER
jgi:hypothetical protein